MAKIFFTANTSWYLWNFRKSTIEAFLEKGDDVYCVALRDKYSSLLENLGVKFIDTKISQYGINPFKEAVKVKRLRKIYKSTQPDVAFSFTTKQNIYTAASISKSTRFVPNISGLGQIFTSGGVKRKIFNVAYKFCCLKADHIFFQNDNDIELFKNEKIISQSQSYSRLFGSGVDTTRFSCPPAEKKFSTESFKFVLAARLLVEKGVLYFIEAAKQIRIINPNTEFHIIGPLVASENYPINRIYLDELSTQGLITYHGECDDIETKLRMMDCMVLPTYYAEGVPKTLIEGISCGLAIVTTRNSGCIDTVIEGENGYLVDEHDTQGLVEAIKRYIQLPKEQKTSYSINSRNLAISRFDDRVNISSYLRIAEKLMN